MTYLLFFEIDKEMELTINYYFGSLDCILKLPSKVDFLDINL